MPEGQGKYGDEAEELLHKLKAKAVAIIVVNGNRGDGFEVACEQKMQLDLPSMLETIAHEIRLHN